MKFAMTHEDRSKRNVVLALAAALMLTISVLAQDSETVLHTFNGGHDGAFGGTHLVSDPAGNLYGTAFGGGSKTTNCEVYTGVPGCGLVFQLSPTKHGSWREKVLYTFAGDKDGGVPIGGVVLDSAGNLYGTTFFGGDKKPLHCQPVINYAAGCGVVFKLTPTASGPWTETVLYTFTGGTDGAWPFAGVILDSVGNVYGATSQGGDISCPSSYGCGIVFKLTPSQQGPWTESVLYTFNGVSDGRLPYSGLTFDARGNLYGTTYLGGDTSVSCFGDIGCGVVFQLAPAATGPWTETVLYAFTGGTDGGIPLFNIALDSSGNVYGTTIYGGDTTGSNCNLGSGIPLGCGVVFELTQGSWAESVLYTFTGGSDGGFDLAPVIFDRSGNLYGTTVAGGDLGSCTGGCGVVYKLTPAGEGPWSESILYTFTGTDGNGPESNLLPDSAGNIYGITEGGGDNSCNSPYGCGVVFELTP